MKVVLDCNVVVSAGLTDGTCREVIDRVVRHHQIILSTPILSEYLAVVGRPRLMPYFTTLISLIQGIEQLADIVEPANLEFGLPILMMASITALGHRETTEIFACDKMIKLTIFAIRT